MTPEAQFQLKSGHPGNWDHCRRCGMPRIMHADDGNCGLGVSLGSRMTLLVVVGGMLAVIGAAAWLLATAPAIPPASVIAFACLVIMVLSGGALALPPRRR